MSIPVIGQVSDSILKMNGNPFRCEIETFDMYFDEVGETNEVNKCILEYKGTGLPDLQIFIGVRKSQSEDTVWSAGTNVVVHNGSVSFFFRSKGVGKFIRFRFKWRNTEDAYIDDLRLMSLTKVEDGTDLKDK